MNTWGLDAPNETKDGNMNISTSTVATILANSCTAAGVSAEDVSFDMYGSPSVAAHDVFTEMQMIPSTLNDALAYLFPKEVTQREPPVEIRRSNLGKKRTALQKFKQYFSGSRTIHCCDDRIQIHVQVLNLRFCLRVSPCATVQEFCDILDASMPDYIHEDFYLTWGGKCLQPHITLMEYGMSDGSTIIAILQVLGGASPSPGLRQPIVSAADRISEVVHEPRKKKFVGRQGNFDRKMVRLQAQSTGWVEFIDSRVANGAMGTLMKFWDIQSQPTEYLIKLTEDVGILAYYLVNSTGKADYTLAILNFTKHRTGKSLVNKENYNNLIKFFEDIFLTEAFAIQSAEDMFATVRSYLDKYDMVRESPIWQKLYKFLMYAMASSLFDKVGLSFDTFKYTKLEREALKRKYHMGPDFIHSMLETITFICERGYQCMKLGSMEPLYHSGSQYEEWYVKAAELKHNSQFLTNPEPHGINKFQFLADLNDAIEKGSAIAAHAARLGDFEKRMVKSLLGDLQMIKSNETTKRAAQKDRKAPFSVLIYGGSSVAKSTFTNLLFNYYGKIHNLPIDSEYKYTRNPVDQYWTNFNTTQWCIQLDDIAFMHPNSAAQGDPSLMEMLQVVNNVPFVPTQADLADKGRTPVQSRFVIATTNTEHLNTTSYFSCPLAVQRRLPWVIDVKPKGCYMKEGCMLDGSKVPELQEGDFPDYWDIEIKKITPILDGEDPRHHQRAKVDPVEKFDSIYTFLRWFARVSQDYENLQDKTVKCSDTIAKVVLCPNCQLPVKHCVCMEVQAGDELAIIYRPHVTAQIQEEMEQSFSSEFQSELWRDQSALLIEVYFVMFMVWMYMYIPFMGPVIHILCGRTWLPRRVLSVTLSPSWWRALYKTMGHRVHRKIGYVKFLVAVAGSLGVGYGVYRILRKMFKNFGSDRKPVQAGIEEVIGCSPKPSCDERENPWYKDDYQTTQFDVSPQTMSMKRFDVEFVDTIMLENCVHFRIFRKDSVGGVVTRVTRAVGVAGHIYMCNNHFFPEGEFDLELTQGIGKDGVTRNIRFLVTPGMIRRFPLYDLAFIQIRNVPPKKDITDLFAETTLSGGHKGYYLSRDENGAAYRQKIENIKLEKNLHSVLLDTIIDSWVGKVETPTQNGDCGSLLISRSVLGPILLGIHYLGKDDTVISIKVTKAMVKAGAESFDGLVVQSGVPLMETPTVKKELTTLHFKSPIRYISDGVANVYGSFSGFRPRGSTKVAPTVIQQAVVDRGYQVCHGPPVVNGYEPWRLALLDMTQPTSQMNQDILEECKEAFIADIFRELPKSAYADLMVYDLFTSVNGAAGVTYVDKINRNTSAGFPWGKSKKFFLTPAPAQHGLEEPVVVDAEIIDRVRIILETYQRGERYSPVFAAHLKDEATSFAKIAAKKTRVFTGAPFDWTIVVRMYLLSFIRVVQRNRYVFEAGPGTIAQSLEWEQIREYLTQHGEENMVAGDYKAFDKKMGSILILAAFDIIIAVCRRGGFTEEQLRAIQCVAEDTSFAYVDFHGDLIEFFGSNPSGHPLTVIINGLVNSLYMRYCYRVLSPEKSCEFFKRDVALFTYGDDNVMGVSRDAQFFNHSSIQKVLGDIGVVYTMADKEAESIPYIPIDDVSFLKRTWRWDEDVKAYLAPLEEASIAKSLTVSVVSKTITQEEQAVAIISSAVREYFYFGREIFETKRKMFLEIIDECNLRLYVNDSTFPSWQDLYDDFWRSSERVVLKRPL